jgi:hypothetical protein
MKKNATSRTNRKAAKTTAATEKQRLITMLTENDLKRVSGGYCGYPSWCQSNCYSNGCSNHNQSRI